MPREAPQATDEGAQDDCEQQTHGGPMLLSLPRRLTRRPRLVSYHGLLQQVAPTSMAFSVPRVVDPCCANMGHWPRAGNSTLTFFLGPLEFVGTHYTLQYYYRLFIALRAGTHQGASFQYIFLGALA